MDVVKALAKKPSKISLNNANLLAFPAELFRTTTLENLDAFRAISYRGDPTVPDAIGKLTKLKTLSLGGNGFAQLPDAIGDLQALEALALDYCQSLSSLPKAIARLESLKSIEASYTTALSTLPDEIGKLPRLEKLSLTNGGLKKVPVSLWKATTLKQLYLPDTIDMLPPGISKLTELQELHLGPKALASIAKELPKLEKLTHLSVWGRTTSLPEEVATLRTLEKLRVCHLGLTKLPARIGDLKELVDLDVAGNALVTLLDVVRALPKLKELSYGENKLAREERAEIEKIMRIAPSKRGVPAVASTAKPKKRKP